MAQRFLKILKKHGNYVLSNLNYNKISFSINKYDLDVNLKFRINCCFFFK